MSSGKKSHKNRQILKENSQNQQLTFKISSSLKLYEILSETDLSLV